MEIKYPRTFHLPDSSGVSSDDKIMSNTLLLESDEIIVTEKMDGENTTMRRDKIHARSLDSRDHPSRSFVKSIWGGIHFGIPENRRICGENLYAKHSISYFNLPSYFLAFSVWDDFQCLSWDESQLYLNSLGFHSVPILFRGNWKDFQLVKKDFQPSYSNEIEGYVVRLSRRIHIEEFPLAFGKWVRKNHVQTENHWMYSQIIKNELKNES